MQSTLEYLKNHPEFEKDVLSVISPQDRLELDKIVKVGGNGEYAIVTLFWDDAPALGIRWFNTYSGMPISNKSRVWFVIPGELWKAIISTLEEEMLVYVSHFLYNN